MILAASRGLDCGEDLLRTVTIAVTVAVTVAVTITIVISVVLCVFDGGTTRAATWAVVGRGCSLAVPRLLRGNRKRWSTTTRVPLKPTEGRHTPSPVWWPKVKDATIISVYRERLGGGERAKLQGLTAGS